MKRGKKLLNIIGVFFFTTMFFKVEATEKFIRGLAETNGWDHKKLKYELIKSGCAVSPERAVEAEASAAAPLDVKPSAPLMSVAGGGSDPELKSTSSRKQWNFNPDEKYFLPPVDSQNTTIEPRVESGVGTWLERSHASAEEELEAASEQEFRQARSELFNDLPPTLKKLTMEQNDEIIKLSYIPGKEFSLLRGVTRFLLKKDFIETGIDQLNALRKKQKAPLLVFEGKEKVSLSEIIACRLLNKELVIEEEVLKVLEDGKELLWKQDNDETSNHTLEQIFYLLEREHQYPHETQVVFCNKITSPTVQKISYNSFVSIFNSTVEGLEKAYPCLYSKHALEIATKQLKGSIKREEISSALRKIFSEPSLIQTSCLREVEYLKSGFFFSKTKRVVLTPEIKKWLRENKPKGDFRFVYTPLGNYFEKLKIARGEGQALREMTEAFWRGEIEIFPQAPREKAYKIPEFEELEFFFQSKDMDLDLSHLPSHARKDFLRAPSSVTSEEILM